VVEHGLRALHQITIIIQGATALDEDAIKRKGKNLLYDGVVDTLGSVGATSGAHASVSIKASDSARTPSRESCQRTRVTHDDGNRLRQYEWQNVIEHADNLSKSPQSRRKPTPKYD
jgi:hypothetical protein